LLILIFWQRYDIFTEGKKLLPVGVRSGLPMVRGGGFLRNVKNVFKINFVRFIFFCNFAT